MADASVDFFVSYTSADRPWAEWIAWELEQAGHSVRIQAWDMQPGSNFGAEMDEATRVAERTIAVLSLAFLESPYCRAEWIAAFRSDPTGKERKLVPVRVRECEPEGLLGPIVYVDVVGLSETASRTALLGGVAAGRAKPVSAPAFPGASGDARQPVRRPGEGAAIFNVPVRTRTFVGRGQELERLAEGLSGDGAVAITQVHAIHGMGGVGKTQLAARYAREHRDDYDVIWWVRAEDPTTRRADLAELAGRLGLELEGDEGQAVQAAAEWLERHSRWLVVFDNATDPDAIADLVPEGQGGHVLITSRSHADWRALHAQPLALDVWPRPESVAFLRERTGEQDTALLGEVAEALGDLPLALEQAAAYTNKRAITLNAYRQRLRERAPELFAAGRPLGYEHTVSTVWELAFEQVAEQPVAHQLLGVCAHLAPERIPRELLEALSDHADIGVTEQEVDEAIELLLGYALLTPAGEQTFGMHRLIGQLTRERADPATQNHTVTVAVRLLDAVWPERPWEHEQWWACKRLLAHALAATDHTRRHDTAPEHSAALLVRVGQYQQARAEYSTARQLLERALAIMEGIYGPEHREVAGTLGSLGIVQHQLGEFKAALVSQQRALAIKEAVYGLEHPEVAGTLGNLGNVQHRLADLMQHRLADLRAARASQQRALAIQEAVYGRRHPCVAITLVNLGRVQQHLGDLKAARASQERALAINEAIHGPEHPEVAITLVNLGNVQQQLGDLKAARASQERALAINEAIHGPEHVEVAITLGNLGNVQLQLGDLQAAREHTRRALAIFERFLGPDHQDTRQARDSLASLGGPDSKTRAQARSGRRSTSTTTLPMRVTLHRAKRRM